MSNDRASPSASANAVRASSTADSRACGQLVDTAGKAAREGDELVGLEILPSRRDLHRIERRRERFDRRGDADRRGDPAADQVLGIVVVDLERGSPRDRHGLGRRAGFDGHVGDDGLPGGHGALLYSANGVRRRTAPTLRTRRGDGPLGGGHAGVS